MVTPPPVSIVPLGPVGLEGGILSPLPFFAALDASAFSKLLARDRRIRRILQLEVLGLDPSRIRLHRRQVAVLIFQQATLRFSL